MKANPRTVVESRLRHRHSKTYWLSVATLIGIFVVNTLGFTDTITGSAMGCGRNWPLCNGQLIPSMWSTATLIEYVHRLSVVVGGGLLMWFSVVALRKYGRVVSVRIFVTLALLGVVLEGALGALAVLFVNPPAVMAAHLGIALITFVAMVLVTDVIDQRDRANVATARRLGDRESKRAQAAAYAPQLKTLSRLVWWSIPYGYVAIYVGAYVASTGYGGFFQGWPIPTESPAMVGPAFWVDVLHRTIALGFVLWMGVLVWKSWRLREAGRRYFIESCVVFVFVCLQAVTGALLIATHLSDIAFLLHVTNVSLLFATQCHLGFTLFVRRAAGHSTEHRSAERTRHRHVV
ncbi:heme A synthase [Alicyclobacillus cycloheptanicus]|uniref:Cytochrome c oxidase assembly protein subunit 15 n=1 Tax=Alicyclobacillus cycloheptanicus TaxID=1457 RepID=A0ABT9XL69_9BACL|nr:COX15/CtaA family protein [Alicyclobacillus cycloheptanicus]MDQ0191052.1 cytochrome c oxidase assembly protein subunit 15 [Alicyclobacillus cycloheptanicus]WDM00848.1 heme A synthase [Alicyclobacillus cycloheptanicus]